MTALSVLIVMLGLAFMVETLTEAVFGPMFDKLPALTPHKWALMYVALVTGLVGALVYQFDLVAVLGASVQLAPPIPVSTFGKILTGLAIGKGSNYLHQLISKFFPAKTDIPSPKAPAVADTQTGIDNIK